MLAAESLTPGITMTLSGGAIIGIAIILTLVQAVTGKSKTQKMKDKMKEKY